MTQHQTAPVKTVSDALKRKRKKKKVSTFKRWAKRFILIVLVLGLVFGLYKLDESKLFRINAITVSNNTVLSNEEVIELLNVNINDRIWLTHDFLRQGLAESISSIESFKFYKNNGVLMIDVNESRPVGIKGNELLLTNGKRSDITTFNQHYRMRLPLITGFDSEELLVRLAMSLSELEPEILMIIASVNQFERTYDQAQLWLLLNDRRQVYSDFRSVHLLNNYPLFVDQIAPGNDCIFLDASSLSARSAPCE